MKYPIGIQTFRNLRNDGFVYVDKTDLVWELAQKAVCFLSRPRRFGKSLMLSTLESYFLGEKELFEGLKIQEKESIWKKYVVFRIDFANVSAKKEGGLEKFLDGILSAWEVEYGKAPGNAPVGLRFKYILDQACNKSGSRVVVLIDEYDKPILDAIDTPLEEVNRDILREFYGTFKAADASLRFVMLTGVTKFSQVSVFSGFNQPADISMDPKFDAICGITEKELIEHFGESIALIGDKYGLDYKESLAMLKAQYDGYHFSDSMLDIYNPFSLLNAFDQNTIRNYWYESGTPTFLVKLIERNNVNIQELISKEYRPEYFTNYKADKADPLAMFYQSGYLTIKKANLKTQRFTLDFPNTEVKEGFIDLLANETFHTEHNQLSSLAMDMDDYLQNHDIETLMNALTAFFASIPYDANLQERSWSFEDHYQYTLYLTFRMLSCYSTVIEKKSCRGRCDMIVETDDNVFIFEFKLDGATGNAQDQIEAQGYTEPYLNDSRKITKLAINFSSEKRNITEWSVI